MEEKTTIEDLVEVLINGEIVAIVDMDIEVEYVKNKYGDISYQIAPFGTFMPLITKENNG